LPTPLLVLPGVSSAQVSWRPNIFGGKDYRLANSGRIESRPNIFGGQDFRQRIPRRGVPTEHFRRRRLPL